MQLIMYHLCTAIRTESETILGFEAPAVAASSLYFSDLLAFHEVLEVPAALSTYGILEFFNPIPSAQKP
jgi:hypothetical protein